MTPEIVTVPLPLTLDDVRRMVEIMKAGNILHVTAEYEVTVHPDNLQAAFEAGLAPYSRVNRGPACGE